MDERKLVIHIFIEFPEFFKDKDYDIDLYLCFDTFLKGKLTSIVIIFTRSKILGEIKEAAGRYLDSIKKEQGSSNAGFFNGQKIYESLQRDPIELPKLFKPVITPSNDYPGYDFENNSFRILVEKKFGKSTEPPFHSF